jgi:hypothetical protein
VVRTELANELRRLFRDASREDWPWFEDRLTYCNARLSQALLVSGARLGNDAMCEAALRSLAWLVSIQRNRDGYFSPIGSSGFYARGGPRAWFDQQPVETASTLSACLEAARFTGEAVWLQHAQHAFDWFLGQNALRQPLYEPRTGGCRDGLHEDRVNENQGAESTLSYLVGLLEMRAHRAAARHRAPRLDDAQQPMAFLGATS